MLYYLYHIQNGWSSSRHAKNEIALLPMVPADDHPPLSQDLPEVSSCWEEVFPSHCCSELAHGGPILVGVGPEKGRPQCIISI